MDNRQRVDSIKKTKPFKWCDIAIVLGVIFLGVLVFLIAPKKGGDTVRVYSDGQLVRQVSLFVDIEFTVTFSGGYNVVKVEGGRVKVVEADCKNDNCVSTGWISRTGESIVCLPHRLVVEIANGDTDSDFDGVA